MKKKSTPGIGFAFLRKIIEGGIAPVDVMKLGVSPDMFLQDERIVYDYYASHWRTYNDAPSLPTVEVATDHRFGSKKPTETLQFYSDQLAHRFKRIEYSRFYDELSDLLDSRNVEEIEKRFSQIHLRLSEVSNRGRVSKIQEAMERNAETFQRRVNAGSLSGVRFGMPMLDELTDGAQPGDIVTLVGRMKMGKTYFLLNWAMSAYLGNPKEDIAPKTVLFITMEMSKEEIAHRATALFRRMNPWEIKKGRVSYFAVDRIVNTSNDFKVNGANFYLLDGGMSSPVEEIAEAISYYKPDAVYIDGAYLLQMERGIKGVWERTFATINYLKILAERYKVPIFCTYQFNRKGAGKVENIAFSDTIGWTSTLVIGIDVYEGAVAPNVEMRKLEFLAGRGGEHGAISVIYDIANGIIEEDRVIETERLELAKGKEGSGRRKSKKHAGRTRRSSGRNKKRDR